LTEKEDITIRILTLDFVLHNQVQHKTDQDNYYLIVFQWNSINSSAWAS